MLETKSKYDFEDRNGLRIEGEGSEGARVAYASETDGKFALTLSGA